MAKNQQSTESTPTPIKGIPAVVTPETSDLFHRPGGKHRSDARRLADAADDLRADVDSFRTRLSRQYRDKAGATGQAYKSMRSDIDAAFSGIIETLTVAAREFEQAIERAEMIAPTESPTE